MKRDDFTLPLGFADELIIDNFAGGGGTSTGLDAAFGRQVNISINHDAQALAMHAATDQAPQLGGPLATVTSHDRFGLVTIQGQDYQIVDIGLRMLSPRALFRPQGFPSHYVIGDDPSGNLALSKSAQVRMCGNSVCPPMSKALVRSNFAHEAKIYGKVAA